MGDDRQTRERDILALAEGVKAVLIGRGWEAPGYWRWEAKRHDPQRRRFRVYYDASNASRPSRIPGSDAPTMFRPLGELRCDARPMSKPTLEAPFDIGRDLEAFEARLVFALKVDDAMPDRERAMLRVRIQWPATSAAPGDYPTGISTRFRPTRAQIDDWYDLMCGLRYAKLSREDKLVMRMKARGAPFRSIATEIRRNEARARTIYRAAVVECWRSYRKAAAETRSADDRRVRGGAAQRR